VTVLPLYRSATDAVAVVATAIAAPATTVAPAIRKKEIVFI
jgi:hypothetical protein